MAASLCLLGVLPLLALDVKTLSTSFLAVRAVILYESLDEEAGIRTNVNDTVSSWLSEARNIWEISSRQLGGKQTQERNAGARGEGKASVEAF